MDPLELDLTWFVRRVTDGEDLTAPEAEAAFDVFMEGAATPVLMAALLAGLRAKGMVASEVAGGVRALQKAMILVPADDRDALVDTAGTGGGSLTTFNISTAAALAAAGAGIRLAKHGNRSYSSRSGSADVLEALGVRIDLTPERMGEVLADAGVVFMFAPLLHPAMRHVGPVRRGLGITTVMNILGPLTNPAGARRQVMGVADPRLLELVAGALAELGQEKALVVHGDPGLDEISPCGSTDVAEVGDGEIRRYRIAPEELGVDPVSLSALAGGEPPENADVIRKVLDGAPGAPRAATLLNAAAAIYVAGKAPSLEEAVARAAASVDEGRGRDALERLRAATRRG